MFHSVPGVPRVKMERFASIDTQTCASPYIKLQLQAVILKSKSNISIGVLWTEIRNYPLIIL
jgi:hypothetical protein